MATISMTPAAGEKCLRFVGDRLRFTLRADAPLPEGWTARLRTDLGRARVLRSQVIHSHFHRLPPAGAQWHDVPMWPDGAGGWCVELPLAEVGYFRAKAYAIDAEGRQHWPAGADVGVTVHPDGYRTANTIYCAFVRQFGGNRALASTENPNFEAQLNQIDRLGYAVIPPSGKLRDLARHLPHIVDTLGCRILHLLPINPTPTVKARMGRLGSPYASQDLLAIDPALVEHENATTGLDQFRELAYATHARGARLFIDLAINHTGWGSTLQENHPEWFVRDAKGEFVSPGAWGVTWGDLVELEQTHVELWDYLADVFLEWCRRGVDGFRCDAGYKVPMRAWQYITARVREEFPDALFLLEGLGGAWALTEELLGDGGMQWAYSELFQEFSGAQVQGYLDHALKQSARAGVLVHYSETHDNLRLAACKPDGRAWSLLRNRLSALTSFCGGFGFTNGVEWLAPEKIRVHQANGLNWGAEDNIVAELASLNRLLAGHPCFFDGAKLTRLSEPGAPVYALLRESADGTDRLLVLVNLDEAKGQEWKVTATQFAELGSPAFDLIGQRELAPRKAAGGNLVFQLPPAATLCLATAKLPSGNRGADYRRLRALAAWALQQLSTFLPAEDVGAFDWRELAAWAGANPERLVAACSALAGGASRKDGGEPSRKSAPGDLLASLKECAASTRYWPVATWASADATRIFLVPPRHWLLVRNPGPFRVSLKHSDGTLRHAESVAMDDGHVAGFAPSELTGDAELRIERYGAGPTQVRGTVRLLAAQPDVSMLRADSADAVARLDKSLVLLTNGLGGMARLAVDFGAIRSKYDCGLGATLHPTLPVDRHVFVKRVRLWCSADGFVSPLNAPNLVAFEPGPPARWSFVANAGDGRSVPVEVTADMLAEHNTTVFQLTRPAVAPPTGRELPADCEVRLIVRVDIEDRNFHSETHRNDGAEHHFRSHSHRHSHGVGFAFTPAPDRQLHVVADSGHYHHDEEWSHCAHPIEATRGQTAAGDAFSPGWFELPLKRGAVASLTLTAHPHSPAAPTVAAAVTARAAANERALQRAGLADDFGRRLALAAQAYVVRRDDGRTVIAGYPWFLDWGRDSLICARGLIAAGMAEEVLQLLKVFGRFEADGTLPNTIHGENASNRDTTDAPLWYGIVAEELAAAGREIHATKVDQRGRTIADVLRSIAAGYLRGTPNGIRVDAASGLVWSPSHFTWMDTNYPAGTPREGYPIEIQALWIRLLRQLERIGAKPESGPWGELAARAEASLQEHYWRESKGWFADVLLARAGVGAREAIADDALRSNMLFAVSLGLVSGERARASVQAALRWLVVPGALRSLAPLAVTVPLEIRANHGGGLLNDPKHPYWGRYEGDEDTRRKPAYHNGTAWTWTFPSFCEALAMAHEFAPEAVAAARAYLGSGDKLMVTGCVGQIPEILDGDAPHTQRGCDAQAWGVTEALRVWKLLQR